VDEGSLKQPPSCRLRLELRLIQDRRVRRGRLLLMSCLTPERGCQKGVRRQRDNHEGSQGCTHEVHEIHLLRH
jgi:hypothetical protein